MKRLIPLFVLLIVAPILADESIDYRFDAVKRRVILTSANHETYVDQGQHAQSGDRVQTGWFSYALIASDRYRARFEIFSATDVQLAGGTPGVVLSLERGRLRAVFDKITGSEPRIVKTPGALLAVRGTQFDVEVDTAGRTTVDVFEGLVEIRSDFRSEPLLVPAGQRSVFGRRESPTARPMPEDRRRNAPPPRDDHGEPRSPRPPDGRDRDHPAQPPREPSQPPPATPPPPRPPHSESF